MCDHQQLRSHQMYHQQQPTTPTRTQHNIDHHVQTNRPTQRNQIHHSTTTLDHDYSTAGEEEEEGDEARLFTPPPSNTNQTFGGCTTIEELMKQFNQTQQAGSIPTPTSGGMIKQSDQEIEARSSQHELIPMAMSAIQREKKEKGSMEQKLPLLSSSAPPCFADSSHPPYQASPASNNVTHMAHILTRPSFVPPSTANLMKEQLLTDSLLSLIQQRNFSTAEMILDEARRDHSITSKLATAAIKSEAIQRVNVDGITPSTPSPAAAGSTTPASTQLMSSSATIDVNECDSHGTSCLQLACLYRQSPLVDTLIELGADINHVNSDGESVLVSAMKGNSRAILLRLLTAPVLDLNLCNSQGRFIQHQAAELGNVAVLAALIVKGIDLNVHDKTGLTPVMIAIQHKRKDAISLLVYHHCNLDLVDHQGLTVLHHAAISGEVSIISSLLRSGCCHQLSIRGGSNDETPAQMAAAHSHQQIAAWLTLAQTKAKSMKQYLFNSYYPSSRRSNSNRPILSGAQLYFLIGMALTSAHFLWYIQPNIDGSILNLGGVLPSSQVSWIWLCLLYLSATLATIGITGFMFLDPGRLVRPMAPSDASSLDGISKSVTAVSDHLDWLVSQIFYPSTHERYCMTCTVKKIPRSKHCSECGICVERMDHHCQWLNSCVGAKNHRSFIFVIFSMLTAAVCHTYCAWSLISEEIHRSMTPNGPIIAISDESSSTPTGTSASAWYSSLFTPFNWLYHFFAHFSWTTFFFIHSSMIIGCCLFLLFSQARVILRGITTNEYINRERYNYINAATLKAPFSSNVRNHVLAFWGIRPSASFKRVGDGQPADNEEEWQNEWTRQQLEAHESQVEERTIESEKHHIHSTQCQH